MPHDALLEHCLELLSPVGRARSRRMFGGQGLYLDELFIALIAFDRLYLKADDETRPRFEAAGCQPFTYPKKDGTAVVLSYWTAPDEAMDSSDAMAPWARLAMAAALRSRQAAPKKARPLKTRKVQARGPAPAAIPAASAATRRTASARPKR
jgi:DNA transformation protein